MWALAFSAIAVACGGEAAAPDTTPVAVVVVGGSTVASGSTLALSASATNRSGSVIAGTTFVWSSADPAIASVSNAGVVTGGAVGTTTIKATAGGIPSTGTTITVTPGAPAVLVVKTQPAAGLVGSALAPILVEIRDAAGNPVPTATPVVTASIATGGGTVSGTPAVAAVGGVATFSNLLISNSGIHTLSFSATGLTGATSTSIDVTIPTPPTIAFSLPADTIRGVVGSTPSARTMLVTNAGSGVVSGLTAAITYAAGEPSGWLSATLTGATAPATLTYTAATTNLPVATYHATVSISSTSATNSPRNYPIVLVVGLPMTYGTPATKINQIDIGGTVLPAIAGADATVAFVVRSPGIATVDATGKITGAAPGDTWVVATQGGVANDSVFVIVPGSSTSPILRADISQAAWSVGEIVTFNVILDTRSATKLGAVTGVLSWSNDFFEGVLSFVDAVTTGSPMPPTLAIDTQLGTVRFSAALVAGVAGPVQLIRVRLRAKTNSTGVKAGFIYLNASEVVASDLTNLLPQTTSQVRYPVIIK